jgi:non-specific serine/threonine protein kinase/serine/threonine-protein kinase
MIPARWSDVKEKLQLALEMGPAEQAAYLDDLEATDPEMRREVESLLASHDQVGDTFLNAPAHELTESDSDSHRSTMIGRRIGAYRIVDWIGAGGMGEVYRAARADEQFEKQAALKLVRTGPDCAFVIGRFKKERQILAGLDHPNIARLFDGGTTEDGVPYFVMELIEGQPIDEYCDAHSLSINERLALFRQVCSAVQYAHQLLIIHRDIKPGNILVTAEGVPKLLDFGIAKILSEEAESQGAEATQTAFAALTPGYASPEQVMGKPITTASDVYSLGVVLYELLTGRRPYRISSRSPQEIARAVCETEPEKPSTAVTRRAHPDGETGEALPSPSKIGAVRDGSTEKLRKRLEGDLDNIVLMALRKEPMRRYASVDQFSQDIERHLEHLPVIARKATLAYTARKFVSRHRTGVAAAILVAASLIAGLVVSLREASIARAERARAERRFNDVRNLSNTLLFKIDDSIKNLPGSTEARHLLVSSAQQYLDSLSQEAGGDVSLLRELAEGYQKLGLIQGSGRSANLGDSKSAIKSLRKAVALREAIARANPSDRRAQHELQKSYEELADPLLNTDLNEASIYVDKSLSLAEALYREDSSNTDLLKALINASEDKAQVLTRRNDLTTATTVQAKGLELAKQLVSRAPGASSQTMLSYEHKRLGGLLIAQKEYTQALSEYEAAKTLDESLLAAHPDDANARYSITFTYSDIGYIEWKQGNYTAALANYQKVLGIREALAKADAHDAHAITGVARTCRYIGDVLRDQKKPDEALQYDLRQLSILDQQAAKNANDRQLGAEIAEATWDVGDDYLAIAETRKDKAERDRRLNLAQHYLLQAQTAMADAKAHGLLYGDLLDAPRQIEQDLARCATLLHASDPGKSADSASAKRP